MYFLLWKAKCRNELFKHSETVITHRRFCSLRSELPSSHGSQGLNKGDWQRGKWRLKSGSHSAPNWSTPPSAQRTQHLYVLCSKSYVPGMAISNLSVHQRGEQEHCTSIQRQWSWKCVTTWEIFGQIQYSTLFSSVAQSCPALWDPWTIARQASLSITNSQSPPKPMSIESVMPSNHLILYRPLLLLPSIFPSITVFSNESALLIRWPKYWSFSFNISPSKEHPGLISFRMDWLDALAVQGTLKSLLQRHSSKASILRRSAFFTVQLSHPYMTTGKTIALTRWTFVNKVISLLFNMLSRLVIAFFSRSKHHLISWLQSPSAVIMEPRKIVSHCCHCFPIYFPWSDGTRHHDLSYLNVELEANFFTLLFHQETFSSSSLSAIRVVSSGLKSVTPKFMPSRTS